jgi:hypothetical protein
MIDDAFQKKKYECELCGFYGKKLSNWTTHISTRKHKNSMKFNEKKCDSFFCNLCNYSCNTISDLQIHNLCSEHKEKLYEEHTNLQKYKCDICNKEYKSNNSLWYHKKKCTGKKDDNIVENSTVLELIKENYNFKNLLIEQMKENKELMNKMVEITQTSITVPTTINNNNNTTNNNQFNLNLFLNETCKNAINFTDFIDNIQVTDNDLENNARMGFVDGITKIIMDNLKQLELNNRPIHCTDVKRETIYVKEENQWEKDHSKEVIQKGIQEITRKNMCQLSEWRENNPEYDDMETETGEKSIVMQQTSMAGGKRDKFYPKIIKNIAKETIIDK